MKKDVVALGELLIDFTFNGKSEQGNPILKPILPWLLSIQRKMETGNFPFTENRVQI